MGQFIVTRYGSNAANQSMTPSMIVGIVEADTLEEARAEAVERFKCYNNQYLGLDYADEATDEDREEAFEADRQIAEQQRFHD